MFGLFFNRVITVYRNQSILDVYTDVHACYFQRVVTYRVPAFALDPATDVPVRAAIQLSCVQSGQICTCNFVYGEWWCGCGSSPGYDRENGSFSVLLSQHLCLSACLIFIRTEHTKVICTLKIPCPGFDRRRPHGCWYGNTQILYNSSRMVRMMSGAIHHGSMETQILWNSSRMVRMVIIAAPNHWLYGNTNIVE